ncbi:AIPR family protein [Vibrio splendidus]|uniref:AIPR family protein n=1 Tax=Vibrio splendidus TaxID=29497 RepID=UPI000D3640C7|nr:AIPR family protein [Vibrio splendidus]PTO71669.1 abortive phage resistance protein [Vibrio splendidus]
MALINDFKILQNRCIKYYEMLNKEVPLHYPQENPPHKARIGFYLFMLENICNVKDIHDQLDLITDLEFNKCLYGKGEDDWGVDAVHIDYEDRVIRLFNFKYREKFSPTKAQGVNETILSAKFVNGIIYEKLDGFTGKVKAKAEEVIKCLTSDLIWDFKLYVVSNEVEPVSSTHEHLAVLRDSYGLEIVPIALPYISEIMSIRPNPINAKLVLDTDAMMSYEEHQLSSSKSYITRLRSSEIVRVTCHDPLVRDKYDIEDISTLSDVRLDFGVLFDNVRGFVLNSKYNRNITTSLKEDPSKFFMYNNGITIVANSILARPINGGKKFILELQDFQILNGGQTVRTIHNFNNEDPSIISDYLSKSEVLVRIFNTSNQEVNSVHKIAEYTNSQNAISNIDLKSLSVEQIELEQYLEDFDIIYSRKLGDVGKSESKEYKHKISMDKFGQVLFATQGYPEKSSNEKQHIFGKYYDQVFKHDFDLSAAPEIIDRYYAILNFYNRLKPSGIVPMELKYYYVLHLYQLRPEKSLIDIIYFLEEVINHYDAPTEMSIPRRMIQLKFKHFVHSMLDSFE